ncbi:MAG: hypothetical protein AAFY60_12345, partial [Myxococcota bacterium]
ELAPNAKAFDVPQAPAPLQTWPLACSLEFICEVTVERVRAHAITLADRLLEQLPVGIQPGSCLDDQRRSGILVLELPDPDTAARLHHALMTRRIHLAHRGRHFRISPHLYNTFAEVDELAAVLRDELRQNRG